MRAYLPAHTLEEVLKETLSMNGEKQFVEQLIGFIWEQMSSDAVGHMMDTLRKWHDLNGEPWPTMPLPDVGRILA